MKRIMYVILALFIASIGFAIQPTYMPNGLSTFEDDQDTMTSSTTVSGVNTYGDVWVKGGLKVAGKILSVNTDGLGAEREYWYNAAAADSDTIKSVKLTTSTLANLSSGTTKYYAEAEFSMTTYGRTVGTSFDIQFASNMVVGSAKFYGIDCRGNRITETVTTTGTVTYSNNAFLVISSASLTITTWDGAERGSDIGGVTGTSGDLAYLMWRVGTGPKLGLKHVPLATTPLSASENGAKVARTGCTLSTTYSTVEFASVPDGNQREATYRYSVIK